MGEFYTERYFARVARDLSSSEQLRFCNESRNASGNFDVFLSYNISDQDVVKGVYYELCRMGLRVYLDIMIDNDLKRSETDKETAQRIRNRLQHSRSLIYAQSSSAATSNWMPWELGIVDGQHGKCMILPVANDANRVSPKREYLLLYPYIKFSDIYRGMRVFKEEETSSSIRDFINL